MNLEMFLAIFVFLLTVIIANGGLIFWLKKDIKYFELKSEKEIIFFKEEINSWKEEINKEIKEFRARFCSLEEIYKSKKE